MEKKPHPSPSREEERVTLFPATGFPTQMEFRSTQQNQTKSDCKEVRHILRSINRCLMSGLYLTEDAGNLLWFHSKITVELV